MKFGERKNNVPQMIGSTAIFVMAPFHPKRCHNKSAVNPRNTICPVLSMYTKINYKNLCKTM